MNKDLIISILVAYVVFDLTSALLYYKNNPQIINLLKDNVSTQNIIIALVIALIIGCVTYYLL